MWDVCAWGFGCFQGHKDLEISGPSELAAEMDEGEFGVSHRFVRLCHSWWCLIHIRDIRRIIIFFLFLQPQLLQIHLSLANLTTAIHYTHKLMLISTNFNALNIHWHVSLQTLQNIYTSYQYSKNYTGFQSNKESITNSVFSQAKH